MRNKMKLKQNIIIKEVNCVYFQTVEGAPNKDKGNERPPDDTGAVDDDKGNDKGNERPPDDGKDDGKDDNNDSLSCLFIHDLYPLLLNISKEVPRCDFAISCAFFSCGVNCLR